MESNKVSTMSTSHMKKKVYRSKRLQFVLLLYITLLTGITILFSVMVILNPGEPLMRKIYALLSIGIFLMFSSAFCMMTVFNRIIVSSEGVECYVDSFHMYTPWTNVVGITYIRHPLVVFRVTPVLVFRQPALLNMSLEEGKRQGLPVLGNYGYLKLLTATPMNYLWYMPLPKTLVSPFDLEQGDFSMYICQYAPSLLNH